MHQKGVLNDSLHAPACLMCSAAIHQSKLGRKKIFCSDACRLHFHRAKPPGKRNGIDFTPKNKIIAAYKKAFRCMGPGSTQRKKTDSLHLSTGVRRPLALDLFCGGGGASVGLYFAGYDVIGVDHVEQPSYPFTFIKADALEFMHSLRPDGGRFSLIWASPPCQQYSVLNNALKRDYPDLVRPVRISLQRAGVNWIMENVPGAPFIDPVCLTGGMFGLAVIRRRHFESNASLVVPLRHPERGSVATGHKITVAGTCSRREMKRRREAMGIDWLSGNPLAQAVPPVYSWYLARQFVGHVA